jgi:hypothetical protein
MNEFRKMVRLAAIVAFLSISTTGVAQSGVDLDGKNIDPLASSSGKIVVLVFVRRDCPVSSRYAPVIQRISADHEHDANFWLVDPDKADSADAIRKYLADYGYQLPALRDPNQALVKLAHVEITPEAAVFDQRRRLIYDGRIDNWYVDLTHSRPAASTHELEDAIHAALDGRPLDRREVRGVGCYISDIE